MKIIRFFLVVLIFMTNGVVNAALANKNDYDADYYENEGPMLFKVRPYYSEVRAKHENLPPPINPGQNTPSALINHGYGVDTSTSFFFTDYIAAESSLGIVSYKVKSATLLDIFNNYGTGTATISSSNDVYVIPVAGALQFHPLPFGGISPYVGLGYQGSYPLSRAKEFKLRASHGLMVQAGVDLIGRDDKMFTLDIRQYYSRSKISYRRQFLNPGNDSSGTLEDIKTKIKWDPIIFSVGFGFRF
ncbi:MAG: hypothetical protein HRU35_05340 [Rickettsiaceae bacterium]|nr:hypothetical protein [Rickettsiaceae bacterium]